MKRWREPWKTFFRKGPRSASPLIGGIVRQAAVYPPQPPTAAMSSRRASEGRPSDLGLDLEAAAEGDGNAARAPCRELD